MLVADAVDVAPVAAAGSTVPSVPVPYVVVPTMLPWLPSLGLHLQVEFDTGSCKTLATIAGHLQKDADYCRCLPTSSKLADCLARYGGIQNHG